jgi:AcrR family transcriptional regulator
MPRNKDDEKRERIMVQARRLFANRDKEKASIRELARLTDMTPSSLYTYFPSIQDLVSAIVEESWDWMQRDMENAPSGSLSKEETLSRFCEAYMPELASDEDLCSLLIQYPLFLKDIDGKLSALGRLMTPGLERFSQRFGVFKIDDEGRKAQASILYMGCVLSLYLSSAGKLDVSGKDIIKAFRSFLIPE